MNGAPSPSPADRAEAPTTQPRANGFRWIRLHPSATSKYRWLEQPPHTSKPKWLFLLGTLTVDGLVAFALAFGQLALASTGFAPVEAAVLSAIGAANLWAANSVRQALPTWAREALIAQLIMLFMAVYIIVIAAFKSPQTLKEAWGNHCWQQYAVLLIALTIGLLALAWIFVLAPQAKVHWTKTAAIITALFPLAGLLQFWMETYYIPQTLNPQVDLLLDLSPQDKGDSSPDKLDSSPQNKPGSIIHLAAKVTVHNRGTTRVNVAGGLMRVTGYASTTQNQEPAEGCRFSHPDEQWCRTEGGLDLSGANFDSDFRVDPTPPADAHLLYAGTMGFTGSFLAPGETDTFEREVDLDPKTFRLARMSVSAIILNERRITDTRSCWQGTHVSEYKDSQSFSQEVGVAQPDEDQMNVPVIDPRVRAYYTCIEDEIAPRDIIDWLTGNSIILRVEMFLTNPQDPFNEYPQLSGGYHLANQDRPDPENQISRKIEEANPMAIYQDESVEYAAPNQVQPKGKD